MSARYKGSPQVQLLPDGRHVRLLAEFGFVDAGNQAWDVPTGATVDGASIPRFVWPIIGGPFEGRYRDASIIHDWYCDIRTRSWEATHRVFYEAMRVSEVSDKLATVMYAAVRFAGPRWKEEVSMNTNLWRDTPRLNFFANPPSALPEFKTRIVAMDSPGRQFSEDEQAKRFAALREEIERNEYPPEQIDRLIA